MSDLSPEFGYYLGCPQWTHRPWNESIFPSHTQPRDALFHYTRAFNTVEGNTTFYATPSEATIDKWANDTPANFRFVFKPPQDITHTLLLKGDAVERTVRFLDYIAPLGSRVGPLLIQLPAHFSTAYMQTLYDYLRQLPRPRDYVVEVRAIEFFEEPMMSELNDLLSSLATERAWMDTRPLRHEDATLTEEVLSARQRKPNMPVYPIGRGPHPMSRYVAHPRLDSNEPWLRAWTHVFAKWIKEGRTPYFFAHYPGETLAPQVADRFHTLLSEHMSLPTRPVWPSERQPSLF